MYLGHKYFKEKGFTFKLYIVDINLSSIEGNKYQYWGSEPIISS